MSRRAVILLVVGLLVAATATFLVLRDSDEGAIDVSLEQPTATPDVADSDDAPLRIAVAAMTSPKETFVHYEELLDYIGAKLGREVDLVQRESYEEVNDLLEVGELDLAFVCTGAYVEGHDAFDMQIVAAPVAYGEPVYYSYLIVGDDSGAGALEDLRGTRFAFTDPLSNTGHLVPVYMLGQLGETPETFFASTTYTYSHDTSIEAVSSGVVDGAAVDSLIYDYLKATASPTVDGTRILLTSPPYGIPPVVCHPDLDPALKDAFRTVLLDMHTDPVGRVILAELHIDRFEVIDDAAYDSVREMQAWLDANPPAE